MENNSSFEQIVRFQENQNQQQVFAILLLGGKSSRMGTRKDNLTWYGLPLWNYLFDLMAKCTSNIDNVYISGTKNHPNAIIDLVPNQGPLMGLYSVLKVLRFGGKLQQSPQEYYLSEADNKNVSFEKKDQLILVLPVDMPLIEEVDLKPLLQFSGDACVWENLPLPVCFKYSENLFSILQEIVFSDQEPHSFRYLLEHLQVEHKVIAPHQSLRLQGANTPKEWEAIHEFKNQQRATAISPIIG
jgi:molybdopterin-guanine dinucleotide biosynthesis protein A